MAMVTYWASLRVVVCYALAFGLAGCAGPVAAYHNIEGGAIAQSRQAPPGADQPYPNLASVPSAPTPPTEQEIAAVGARLTPAPKPIPALVANPEALEGLTLPDAPPPAPNVPGVYVPAAPTPHVITYAPPPPAPPAVKKQDSAPVSLAFAPGSAILDGQTNIALFKLAGTRGDAMILAGGFGQLGAGADAAALKLAIARARAIANAMTAAGVPADHVALVAAADGAGGFVQLVY